MTRSVCKKINSNKRSKNLPLFFYLGYAMIEGKCFICLTV